MRGRQPEQYRPAAWVIAFCLAVTGPTACENASHQPPAPPQSPAPAGDADVSAEDVRASLAAAQSYLASGESAKAEAILAVLVDKAPRESRAWEMYALVFIARAAEADPAAAIPLYRRAYDLYRRAVELDPESPGLHQSAGEVAHSAGLLDEALDHYRAAGRLDPVNPKPPLYLAQILITQEDYDQAASALQRVLLLDPDEPLAHASLAIVALEQDRFDAALQHIAQARVVRPHDVRFRAQEARIHRRRGDPQKAVELLAPLSSEARADGAVAFELAFSYEALGEHAKAAETWEHRYRSAPRDPRAYLTAVRAGHACLRANRRESAGFWLRQAKLLRPQAPEVIELERALAGVPNDEAP